MKQLFLLAAAIISFSSLTAQQTLELQTEYGSDNKDEIPNFTTFYEKMWLEEGLKINYLRFKLDLKKINRAPE